MRRREFIALLVAPRRLGHSWRMLSKPRKFRVSASLPSIRVRYSHDRHDLTRRIYSDRHEFYGVDIQSV